MVDIELARPAGPANAQAASIGVTKATKPTEPGDGLQTLGTFFVGDIELALSADRVREVVPFPKALTPIPLTPSEVLGAFTLRGEILPLLDMTGILSEEGRRLDPGGDRRVAVIDIGDGYVGAAFDRTGEVLRVKEHEIVALGHQTAERGRVIEAIAQLEGGERSVQLVSPTLLGALPGLPSRTSSGRAEELFVDERVFRKAILVEVGPYQIAFPMEALIEIQSAADLLASPAYFEHCVGLVQLRDETFGVMDLRAVLGLDTKSRAGKHVFVSHGDTTVALAVDALVETLEFDQDKVLTLPRIEGSSLLDLVQEVIPVGDERHVFLLEPASLFGALGVEAGLEILGDNAGAGDRADIDAEDEEQAVFTFQVVHETLSLDLDDVLEVQPLPAELIRSGSTSSAVMGMMNLRGEIIPLFDLARRIGMVSDLRGEGQGGVVIVVERGGERVGLIVNRVERIVRFRASQVTPVGQTLRASCEETSLLRHVRSGLLVTEGPDEGTLVAVLDLDSI